MCQVRHPLRAPEPDVSERSTHRPRRPAASARSAPAPSSKSSGSPPKRVETTGVSAGHRLQDRQRDLHRPVLLLDREYVDVRRLVVALDVGEVPPHDVTPALRREALISGSAGVDVLATIATIQSSGRARSASASRPREGARWPTCRTSGRSASSAERSADLAAAARGWAEALVVDHRRDHDARARDRRMAAPQPVGGEERDVGRAADGRPLGHRRRPGAPRCSSRRAGTRLVSERSRTSDARVRPE